MRRIPVLLAVGLSACATAAHGPPALELSTGCLENCRAFSIKVYRDGVVDYMGYANVLLGQHTKQVTPRLLAALDQVVASGLAGFDPETMRHCPDDAGTLVSISYAGRHVSVFDQCNAEIGFRLLGRITATLGLDRWLSD